MPPAIAAFAAWVTAEFVAITGSTSLLAAQIVYGTAYAVGTLGTSAALNFATSLIDGNGPSAQGQLIASQAAVEPNRHVVGRFRAFGVTAWQGGFSAKNGDDKNLTFGQIQTISSTPITEFETIYCADVELVPVVEGLTGMGLFYAAGQKPFNRNLSTTKSRLYYNFDEGAEIGTRDVMLGWWADQPWQPLVEPPYLDPTGALPLQPFYPVDARGDGLAKLSSVAWQDATSFPGGPPRMSAVVKGLRCFDPRDPDQDPDDSDTWEFTINPTLIAGWYITRPFGFAASYEDIDLDTFIAAANACDEEVETFASTGATGSPPMEPRYAMGGEIIEGENRDDILAQIVAAMAGSWVQTAGGQWFLYAGVFAAPVIAIDDTWIMRNVEFTAQRSRLQLYNTVNGKFLSEARRWQPAPYPQVQLADYVAQDNGQEIVETIDFSYVQSHTQAQRCMIIEVRRIHKPRVFKFETPIGYALRLAPGETVSLTQIKVGYAIAAVPFRVSGWEIGEQDGSGQIWVTITLDEDGEDIYDVGIDDLTDTDALTPGDNNPGGGASGSSEGDAPDADIEAVYA